MQVKQRFVADQRFDLEHLERSETFTGDEFAKISKNLIYPENRVIRGWKVVSNGSLQVKVSASEDSLLVNSQRTDHENLILQAIADDLLTLDLADNATNYVEVKLSTVDGSPETIVRWDRTANANKGAEYTQVSNTCTHEMPSIVSNTVSFSGDDDKLPLAVVTTAGGVITDITDARELLYAVISDWDFGTPRSDRTIGSIGDAHQALATAIKEAKGTSNWYDLGWSSNRLLKEYQNMFVVGGGNIEWEGGQGANTLGWSSAIELYIADRTNSYSISAGTATLTDGQAAYVIIPNDVASGALTVHVAALSAVPINPASGSFDARIQVLFFRKNNVITSLLEMPDLSSGEIGQIGMDLPNAIRSRLGITSETAYVAYGSTIYIGVSDSYAVAIGKLDAAIAASSHFGYDAVVGSAGQVTAGLATHSTLQAAHDAVAANGTILLLKGGSYGNLTCTKTLYVSGFGYGTSIGTTVIQANHCIFKGFKMAGNFTIDNGFTNNQVLEFFRNGNVITDSNAVTTDNLFWGTD